MISTAVGDEQQINLAILNADKHSPASCARSTKRRVRGMLMSVELKAPTDRSRSDCVHEQVSKRIANVRFTADKHPPLQAPEQ